MTIHKAPLRCGIVYLLLLGVLSISAQPSTKEKRQVTYQADEGNGADQEPDVHLVRPVTKKPLPAQVVYPGDLTSFYTTVTPDDESHVENNAKTEHSKSNSSAGNNRSKRSFYNKDVKESNPVLLKLEKPLKSSQVKYRMSESRLHSSYHKPSVSVMNDIPAEMYFDGAGFLRYEDESEEEKAPHFRSPNYDRSHSRSPQDNNKALSDFREAFNISHERMASNVKFDDDVSFPNGVMYSGATEGKNFDYGAQETENGSPLSVDFLNAYQKEMFQNIHNNYAQMAQNQNSFQQDPFSFTYPNFYNPQPSFDQTSSPVIQQQPLLQNHRMTSSPNVAAVNSPTVYASSSIQPIHASSGYAQNLKYPQYPKSQRKRRSVIIHKRSDEKIASASEPNEDHYPYSRLQDQQDSSSGFIPITGSFNGGTIQLNFPIFGGNPISTSSYSPRSPVQSYHSYSVPMQPEGRQYRSSMERFYHPSEARRYSYGILGSGNFEVIRGGVFPGERHQGFSGGYQDGRIPYGSNDYGNYGTTEIILDGPIQGFQGFDNFPAHLINALSKHSELSIHPDRRATKDLAS